MDWKTCKDARLVKEAKPDTHLIKSLLKTSANRLETAKRLPLDEVSAASAVSLVYDRLREMLEAVALMKGYKIYNHECFCAFLKEVVHEERLGNVFDRHRKIRNQINYYGKDIPPKEAKELTREMQDAIKEARKLLKS